MVTLKINGELVKAGKKWTILETSRYYGFYIPTLCFHESLKPSGSCRLCVVELNNGKKSKLVASCIHGVAEGLNIYTDSKRVKNVRRWILEMLLSETPANTEIIALAKENNVTTTRFKTDNPKEDCVVCELCVRACDEIVGLSIISSIGRGIHRKIGPPFLKPTNKCIGCGTCVSICPTNSMAKKIDSIRILKSIR